MNTTFTLIGCLIFSIVLFISCSNTDENKNDLTSIDSSIENSDTLVYEYSTINKTIGNCGDGNGCLSINLTYPLWHFVPVQFHDKQLLKWTNEKMLAFLQADTSFKNIDQFLDNVVSAYSNLTKDTTINDEWLITRSILITNNSKKFLSLCFEETSFTGGAHPDNFKFYKSFNVTNGNFYRLNDLFKPMYEESLTRIAEAIFRKQKGLPAGQDLEMAGYWFDNGNFNLPNKNFCLTNNGLLFHYNSYEIAPYTMGSTTILIPWGKLESLLKTNFTPS